MNLEIPPGRDRTAVIGRFKAKWYKREIVSAFLLPHLELYNCRIPYSLMH